MVVRKIHLMPSNPLFLSSELIPSNDEPSDEPIASFRESKCCISPIPISPEGDESEDYSDDCLTQEAFAKCLNLVSRERIEQDGKKALLAEYPLRLLSRSRAYRTVQDLPDLKLPDYMPLTSYLGMKILQLNEERNFSSDQRVQVAVKKYDSYCRVPFNSPKPSSCCHFPKLRCREKKNYPIATTAKTLRHDASHFYTYGRRQRQERMRVMQTGLNRRSRRLLGLCKPCSVKLKRLTKAEINSWKKKSPISPSGAVYSPMNRLRQTASTSALENESIVSSASSLIQVENRTMCENSALESRPLSAPPGTSFLTSDSQLPFLLRTPLARGSCYAAQSSSTTFHWKAPNMRSTVRPQMHFAPVVLTAPLKHHAVNSKNCVIHLSNVIRLIRRQNDQYYVRGTRIHVPFYRDFLDMLNDPNRQTPDLTSDHAYASVSKQNRNPSSKTQKAPLKPCNVKLAPCDKSTSYLSGTCSLDDEGKQEIPLIDLTLETTPPKAGNSSLMMSTKSKNSLASKWEFRCFACGMQRLFRNTNFPEQEYAANAAVRDHMRIYHSIVESDCFISKYLDRVKECTIVEAFPGYKETSRE